MSKMLQSTRRQVYIYVCVLCRSRVVLQYPTISSQQSQSIDPRLPGERANNLLLLPPPRSRSPTWKDCEGPDRCAGRWWRAPRLLGEHPRSRWGAERMRSGWNWKCTWKSKVSFYFPPNWIDVKCRNVLVRNIIQIETAFHSLIHLQNKGHFPGGSCVFNSPFGSPQFLFSSLALQRLLSVICGNQKKNKIKNALTDL